MASHRTHNRLLVALLPLLLSFPLLPSQAHVLFLAGLTKSMLKTHWDGVPDRITKLQSIRPSLHRAHTTAHVVNGQCRVYSPAQTLLAKPQRIHRRRRLRRRVRPHDPARRGTARHDRDRRRRPVAEGGHSTQRAGAIPPFLFMGSAEQRSLIVRQHFKSQ